MNFLPLHAIPWENGALGDQFEVSYAPSLSILLQCIARKRPVPTKMFAAVQPLGDELPCTLAESRLVQAHFPEPSELTQSQLTREGFLTEAQTSHVCYWSGHAAFSIQVPLYSGLIFARTGTQIQIPADLITFMDIDSGLEMPGCTLAVLAGCQSGLALAGSGRETISLVTAFLNAGAKCVLASLWPVGDLACMLTMDRFFFHWREEEKCIAASLQASQQWLRDLTVQQLIHVLDDLESRGAKARHLSGVKRTAKKLLKDNGPDHRPFASPFDWAPFVVVGQSWPDDEPGGQ